MKALWICGCTCAAAVLFATATEYASARAKIDSISGGRLRAGSQVVLSAAEINAYALHEAPKGVYDPKVSCPSPGIAVGSATIDFGEVRRAQGAQPGWLMGKLLDGKRPVRVTVRIESGKGQATVFVQKVEISGLVIDGKTLDFLIENLVMPLYPNAAVNHPFPLATRADHVEVRPAAVTVFIGR